MLIMVGDVILCNGCGHERHVDNALFVKVGGGGRFNLICSICKFREYSLVSAEDWEQERYLEFEKEEEMLASDMELERREEIGRELTELEEHWNDDGEYDPDPGY